MSELTTHPPVEQTPTNASSEHAQTHHPHTVSGQFIKVFGAFIVGTILIGTAVGYFQTRIHDVPENFEQCAKKDGSRIQESYPATCITIEGQYFIQNIDNPLNDPALIPLLTPDPELTPIPNVSRQPNGYIHSSQTCKRVGCSGELCVHMSAEDTVTDCSYRAEYACYQEAPCERQADGQCGFTPSAGLSACLQNAKQSSGF